VDSAASEWEKKDNGRQKTGWIEDGNCRDWRRGIGSLRDSASTTASATTASATSATSGCCYPATPNASARGCGTHGDPSRRR